MTYMAYTFILRDRQRSQACPALRVFFLGGEVGDSSATSIPCSSVFISGSAQLLAPFRQCLWDSQSCWRRLAREQSGVIALRSRTVLDFSSVVAVGMC